MPVCAQFVSNMSDIIFNPSAGAITDHSQSAQNIDPYFKSQLYVEDPGHRNPVLILSNELSKARERAHDRNYISAVGEIRTQPLDRQSSVLPLSYHRSLNRQPIWNFIFNNNSNVFSITICAIFTVEIYMTLTFTIYQVQTNIPIDSQCVASYLMVIVIFALSVTVYEIFVV